MLSALFSFLLVFSLGLITGSFLNSQIYRAVHPGHPKSASRSFCPHCRHSLAWYDLIPLLSFFLLRARCRHCQKPISWQYPLVELATGIIFVLIFNYQLSIINQLSIVNYQLTISLFYHWLVFSLLLAIFVSDLRYLIIPDKFIYPAIGLAFLYQLFRSFELLNPLASAFISSLIFLAIFLVSRGKWLGFGDVKLAFFIGLFLGFPKVLAAFFFAFGLGAIMGLALIALKKANLKSQVAFGPFLIAGACIAFFWGEAIAAWYLRLVGL